jgi:hypothetical protein
MGSRRGGVIAPAVNAPPANPIRFAIEPPQGVSNISSVAVAADGRFAVYEAQVDGEYRFFMRRFDAIDSHPIAGTEGARGPFLSLDGAWIGFVRNATLFKVSTAGGYIVFYRTGRYHAIRYDLASSNVSGEPFPVLEDAQELDPAGDWGQPVSVGSGGVLAYLPVRYVPPSRLTWIDAQGRLTPLAFAPRPFIDVKLSPDGQRSRRPALNRDGC